MKKLLLLPLFMLTSLISFGQTTTRAISITLKDFLCEYRRDLRPTADSAFKIASAILSSPEFQDEIAKMTFQCDSYCNGCNALQLTNGRISGTEVLNKLFKETPVSIMLELRERGGPLGQTSQGSYHTEAWYESIRADMPELPFAYGLAVNLCHEYMHQVGFCHLYCTGWKCPRKYRLNEAGSKPDSKFINEDVTYKVGWAAYYILKKWREQGKKII